MIRSLQQCHNRSNGVVHTFRIDTIGQHGGGIIKDHAGTINESDVGVQYHFLQARGKAGPGTDPDRSTTFQCVDDTTLARVGVSHDSHHNSGFVLFLTTTYPRSPGVIL